MVPQNIGQNEPPTCDALLVRFREVRAATEELVRHLSDADATVQSMEDASPAKWHLAHTSWFFETFILRDLVAGYALFRDGFDYLFNSYYEAEGARHTRAARGMITRPSLEEIKQYRSWVDRAMESAIPDLDEHGLKLTELGLHHEQQHQELLLTDVKHMFAQNPLRPAWLPADNGPQESLPVPLEWIPGKKGVVEIGHDGAGFAFDCEGPRHETLLTPHELANRCVTNGEWIAFMEDGGYRNPVHWLSDGWAWVQQHDVTAPLYWRQQDGGWHWFTMQGMQPIDMHAPVTHISLFEADAFASWADARLPTEAEWESAAQGLEFTDGENRSTNIQPTAPDPASGMLQMFGDVWEWTGSAYRPYPGFRAAEGAVGEYNGKFMSGQFVLKGGSCATPAGHIRASYRNFFYPHQRWQFTGLRLARDI